MSLQILILLVVGLIAYIGNAQAPSCLTAGECLVNGQCMTVPVGFYSPSGTSICWQCESSMQTGSATCDSCAPAGMCFIKASGFKQCTLAPPGFYSPLGPSSCSPCATTTTYGNAECAANCMMPTMCAVAGSCINTPPGFFSNSHTSECMPCQTAYQSSMTSCPGVMRLRA